MLRHMVQRGTSEIKLFMLKDAAALLWMNNISMPVCTLKEIFIAVIVPLLDGTSGKYIFLINVN